MTPRLDRRAGRAVVDDPALEDHVRLAQGGVHVAAADRPLVRLVRADLLVTSAELPPAPSRVHDDGQRVVLDDHLLGGVDDAVLARADHDGDGLADVLDGRRGLAATSRRALTSTPGGTHAIGRPGPSVRSSAVKTP